MENLQHFEKKKQQLIHYIEQTIQTAQQLQVPLVIEKQQTNLQQLMEEQFLLTVVGEFSRGKSMFINSLLGDQILPSKVKPTTAMITTISYADTIQHELQFRDGRTPKKLTEEEFQALCAPREPDVDDREDVVRYEQELAYFNDIKLANIQYPSALSKLGVKIVDTPGTNDIDVAREEITLSFVPKADAVIVILSATMPVTSDEVMFIKERVLSEHISKVFIILNRMDLLNDDDQKKTLDYTKKILAEFIPNAKIYPMASKDALTIKMAAIGKVLKNKKQRYFTLEETGLAKFEWDLSYFLEHEKGQAKLVKHIQKLQDGISDLMSNTIALRLAALNTEIDEINGKIRQIEPEIIRYRKNTRSIISNLTAGLKGAESSLFSEIEAELRKFFSEVVQELDYYKGNLDSQDAIRRYISRTLDRKEAPFKEKLSKLKMQTIDLHLKAAYEKLNVEERHLNERIYTTFNIDSNLTSSIHVNYDELTGDEILGIMAASAGIGFIGVVFAPALFVLGVIGTIFGGVVFFDEISSFFSNLMRERKIKKLKETLQSAFKDEARNMIATMKIDWTKAIYEIEHAFMKDVDEKTAAIEDNFRKIRLENEQDKQTREKIKQTLTETMQALQSIEEAAVQLKGAH